MGWEQQTQRAGVLQEPPVTHQLTTLTQLQTLWTRIMAHTQYIYQNINIKVKKNELTKVKACTELYNQSSWGD
jgi:hypothetical protein